ncbi:MAG: catalase, partial [Rhizobacter sp.]|nr:catalase [Rhizobacter sp.]
MKKTPTAAPSASRTRPAEDSGEKKTGPAADQALAAAVPFNTLKASDSGRAAAVAPPVGPTVPAGLAGPVLTTNQGVAIGDNQNSLKAGLRGPVLLEDFILREKITHFDHERIPERIVHARGSAAHGFFEAYKPMTEFTRAAPFAAAGKRTRVFVRFSTVAGERGSVDTAR